MSGRVIVVLADGLRPDVVMPERMPRLHALASAYARAAHAVTVRPSVTVAALGSLATGVSPATHRLIEPGLGFLPDFPSLRLLGHELQRHGLGAAAVGPELGLLNRAVATALTRAAGVQELVPGGKTAPSVAGTASRRLATLGGGLLFVYLADCDAAGHAHGWMSAPYLAAAQSVDAAIGHLAGYAAHDLIIVLSDHGGGGITLRDHDKPHLLNEQIPLVLAGPDIRRGYVLPEPVSLLDIPPTVLTALGLPVPDRYEGRALAEVFHSPQLLPEVA